MSYDVQDKSGLLEVFYKELISTRKRDLNMENYLLHENFEKRRLITKLRILTSYVMTMILWCLLSEQ